MNLLADEGRLLLTADKDFGERVFRQHLLRSGIVLIRLAGVPPGRKAEIVTAVINGHTAELRGAFTVISPRQVRDWLATMNYDATYRAFHGGHNFPAWRGLEGMPTVTYWK